jgi:hypothetical protein
VYQPTISEKYSNATKSHQLIFKPIDESFVSKRISNINVKKATGVDNISPKLLHYAKPVIAKFYQFLCFDRQCFSPH